MGETHHDTATMQDLRAACQDRLDHAIAIGDPNLSTIDHETGPWYHFETESGLVITACASRMEISCDFGDTDITAPFDETTVEFSPDSDVPEVTEVHSSEQGHWNRTVPHRQHDRVARELVRFVNLIPH